VIFPTEFDEFGPSGAPSNLEEYVAYMETVCQSINARNQRILAYQP